MTASNLLTADKISYKVMDKNYGQNMFLDSFPRALLHVIGMEKKQALWMWEETYWRSAKG